MTDAHFLKTVGGEQPLVAYFSMEIGLDPGMPTYAGGLGVLAGDTIRSAADLEIPMVAVTLLHRRGYFYQRLDEHGWQHEEPVAWPINDFCKLVDRRVTVEIENRSVQVGAWLYRVRGESGGEVPVYLLDTDFPENQPWDRTLTDRLYGGDDHYRLCQEVVLGFGGYRLLRALGYGHLRRFHRRDTAGGTTTADANARARETTPWPPPISSRPCGNTAYLRRIHRYRRATTNFPPTSPIACWATGGANGSKPAVMTTV